MKKKTLLVNTFFCAACTALLMSCTTVTPGKGGTIVSGSAGGSTSSGANASLERCSEPLGTLAIEYRAGSKQHKGQRVAADYYLEPRVVINNSSLGGVSGTVGTVADGLLGTNVFGAIGGGLDVKSSVVTLSLFDIRSAVQIAASEGSASANNYGAALSLFGRRALGSLQGYNTTPAGKATVTAFFDAYNEMVRVLRSYKAQSVRGGSGTGGLLKVN